MLYPTNLMMHTDVNEVLLYILWIPGLTYI